MHGTRLAPAASCIDPGMDRDEEDGMACPTFVLTGVTAQVWECVRLRATAMGVAVPPGDRGSVHHKLADADYAWDPASATLSITVTRSPRWIGCGAVAARVRKAAAGCGAS